MRARPWLLLSCLPTLGFTECEYFATVTVPAVDLTPPTPANRLFIGGEEILEIAPDAPHYPVSPDTWFDVYSALFDVGGVRTFDLSEQVDVYCTDPSGGIRYSGYTLPGYHELRPGSVGSPASTGVYGIGHVHQFATFFAENTPCAPGWWVTYAVYYWHVSGADFHGNSYVNAWEEGGITYGCDPYDGC